MRPFLIVGTSLFALLVAGILFWQLSLPASYTFQDDAGEYSAGAKSIVTNGMYSLDGQTKTMEREPGYSFFLAIIYFIFGIENRTAIFLAQAMLYLTAVIVFTRELKQHTSDRIAGITVLFLLLTPSIFRIVFSVYRECLALSIFLLFAMFLLKTRREPSWKHTLIAGFMLGCLLLTYFPFVFFPIFLLALGFLWKMNKQHLALLILVPYLFIGAWGLRNVSQFGTFSIAGSIRGVRSIYVRGEQAERLSGTEPIKCLWAEYISRDWSERSDACSFNALMHAKWPDGTPLGNETEIKQQAVSKILNHLPNYLWFSVFEILELHIPYVGGGWPFVYNALAALGMFILFVGCLLGIRVIWKPEYAFFLILIFYNTALFILTDATPRYLMPIFFCYAVLSAVGYSRLFQTKK